MALKTGGSFNEQLNAFSTDIETKEACMESWTFIMLRSDKHASPVLKASYENQFRESSVFYMTEYNCVQSSMCVSLYSTERKLML